jgi:ribosomal protein S14
MPRSKPKWRNTESGFGSQDYRCGYCGRHVSASSGYWCIGEYDSLDHTIAICPKCNAPTYFERHSNQLPSPPFGESVPHINDANIEAIYEEARRCTSHQAFTGAVMLCRKLLMNIAVKHGAPENQSFQSYVEYLDENGFVPPNGKKWVDAIRKKGNEANHEISLMTARDAHNIVRFSEMLLRFVYEMPNMFEGEPG